LTVPRVGTTVPNMGTKRAVAKAAKKPSRKRKSSALADALFSKVQQRVLGVLFGNPGRSFYAKEIIRLAQSGTGAVQRELASLLASGLVTVKEVGKQRHYRANPDSLLFEELHRLALKTFGLADVLRDALEPIAPQISAAFVYGSIARGTDTASSGVDVLVISETIADADLSAALDGVSERLGRKLSPTVYSLKEFKTRVSQGNVFVKAILAQPRFWLIGDERVLTA
jgi:predicted nucleotidyltransferase